MNKFNQHLFNNLRKGYGAVFLRGIFFRGVHPGEIWCRGIFCRGVLWAPWKNSFQKQILHNFSFLATTCINIHTEYWPEHSLKVTALKKKNLLTLNSDIKFLFLNYKTWFIGKWFLELLSHGVLMVWFTHLKAISPIWVPLSCQALTDSPHLPHNQIILLPK